MLSVSTLFADNFSLEWGTIPPGTEIQEESVILFEKRVFYVFFLCPPPFFSPPHVWPVSRSLSFSPMFTSCCYRSS